MMMEGNLGTVTLTQAKLILPREADYDGDAEDKDDSDHSFPINGDTGMTCVDDLLETAESEYDFCLDLSLRGLDSIPQRLLNLSHLQVSRKGLYFLVAEVGCHYCSCPLLYNARELRA